MSGAASVHPSAPEQIGKRAFSECAPRAPFSQPPFYGGLRELNKGSGRVQMNKTFLAHGD